VIDRKTEKLSGATNCTTIADSAPPTLVYSAEMPKVSVLTLALSTPMACAAIAWSPNFAEKITIAAPRISRLMPSTVASAVRSPSAARAGHQT